MPTYQRIFTVATVAETHRLFQEAVTLARRRDQAARRAGVGATGATERLLLRAYGDWQRGLDSLAKDTALLAKSEMRRWLARTAVRPDTRTRPHLRELLIARPLRPAFGAFATGAVGVADEASLDKAINPHTPGYGPYWRAQEKGTGSAEVRSQVGRRIRGYFYSAGLSDPQRPINPPPSPPQPIFIPGRPLSFGGATLQGGIGPRGGRGGPGTIRREIQGRHFIERGADTAEIAWRAAVKRNEAQALLELEAVLGSAAVPGFARAARSRR